MNKKDGIYMPSFNKNILNIIKIIANENFPNNDKF